MSIRNIGAVALAVALTGCAAINSNKEKGAVIGAATGLPGATGVQWPGAKPAPTRSRSLSSFSSVIFPKCGSGITFPFTCAL